MLRAQSLTLGLLPLESKIYSSLLLFFSSSLLLFFSSSLLLFFSSSLRLFVSSSLRLFVSCSLRLFVSSSLLSSYFHLFFAASLHLFFDASLRSSRPSQLYVGHTFRRDHCWCREKDPRFWSRHGRWINTCDGSDGETVVQGRESQQKARCHPTSHQKKRPVSQSTNMWPCALHRAIRWDRVCQKMACLSFGKNLMSINALVCAEVGGSASSSSATGAPVG